MLMVRDIYKAFDGQDVLQGVSLEVQDGEIVALLGPSGCGKTTLLRIIAGLESADHGQLLLDEVDLTQIPIHKRRFGMVFQDYALFPHRNVRQNVAFGLKMMNWAPEERDERVQEVLGLVGLATFEDRPVHELSGGEQQRVALARALAPFPTLLLMDEPLGSLDRALREHLMGELRSILKRAGEQARVPDSNKDHVRERMASIYVTHDQEEAFAIADRIMVMNKGVIEQAGSPIDLYRRPRTLFVARFLGMENIVEADILSTDPPVVESILGRLAVAALSAGQAGPVHVLIRPDAATLVDAGATGMNILAGELVDVSFRGRHQIVKIRLDSGGFRVTLKFNFESSLELPAAPNPIHVHLDPAQLHVLIDSKEDDQSNTVLE